MQPSRLLLLSAYDAVSHRLWAQRCKEMMPRLDWTLLCAAPRHFSWALRGRPLQWLLDPQARSQLQAPYDALVATSTVDLAAIKACCPNLSRKPCLLFMHENQFVYPENQSLDEVLRRAHRVDACMVQLYAILAADLIAFNSAYHQDAMRQGVQAFLARMPVKLDPSILLEKIAKARVLSVPIEDAAFSLPPPPSRTGPLKIVWNHRWEFDKAPERFLMALERLLAKGVDFRLILLGEAFGQRHKAYAAILEQHASRIEHHGMLPDRQQYYETLRQGQVVVSTALHDFQGLSMLEGAASGLFPILPRRLAYPEIYPESCLYASSPQDPKSEAQALCDALCHYDAQRKQGKVQPQRAVELARSFAPSELAASYRSTIQELLGS